MTRDSSREARQANCSSKNLEKSPESEDLSSDMRTFIQEAIENSTKTLLSRIDSLESKIDSLENSLIAKQKQIEKIEASVNVVKAVNKQLVIANDSLEQYGRRMCVRIGKVPHDPGETNDSLRCKLVKIMTDAGAVISAKMTLFVTIAQERPKRRK